MVEEQVEGHIWVVEVEFVVGEKEVYMVEQVEDIPWEAGRQEHHNP